MSYRISHNVLDRSRPDFQSWQTGWEYYTDTRFTVRRRDVAILWAIRRHTDRRMTTTLTHQHSVAR